MTNCNVEFDTKTKTINKNNIETQLKVLGILVKNLERILMLNQTIFNPLKIVLKCIKPFRSIKNINFWDLPIFKRNAS